MNNDSIYLTTNKKFETAVLLLVFNRLDTTKLVFETIKQVKPPKLYIASDGARQNNDSEKQLVQEIRDWLVGQIDWKCEVKTLFREQNLGLKIAVSSAIDWFFENEEMGIIMEDDCLPSQSFFWFCQELLIKYKNDLRIWHISGNVVKTEHIHHNENSYFFGGIYGYIWGWATWRDRWKHYDVTMKEFPEFIKKEYVNDLYNDDKIIKSMFNELEKTYKGLNSWAHAWSFTRFKNNGLTINPIINMIRNIGFGNKSTHTHSKKDFRADLKHEDINFPLKHPVFILRDAHYERNIFETVPQLTWLDHLKIRIKKILGAKI